MSGEVEIVGLLTTVNAAAERVSIHGVRRALLDAQADALGLPVEVVALPWPCPNETYEGLMGAAVDRARAAGIDVVVFGDLFLADVRRYRERMLEGSGLGPLFPLWQQPTGELAGRLLAVGVRAVVACVDLGRLPGELAGRWYDESFLADLPPDVDPCGENGEFHTVVVDSPDFARPLAVTVGEIVERDGFAYADVLPAPSPPS